MTDDFVLAEDLQLEEVLRLSAQPGLSCAVCRQVMPSLEASWKPDGCDHVICIACFSLCAPEARAAELPRCPVATCQSRREPETRQAINVGDGSLISIEWRDSGKGKKPWNDAVQEPGQSSRGGTTSTGRGTYCTICMETVRARDTFLITGCTHSFCVGCVGQYVAAKVEENVVSIGCPDPGCKDGGLHPEACRDVIPPQLFERWDAALRDSALGALKFYCPFKDCSALLVDDPGAGEAAITSAECPHCCRLFCAQCKVAWHNGVDCAEFQRLGKDERGREDLLLRKVAQESKWQRCPKCKMYVERVDGCVYIVCRCGHCFCYLCASPMARGNNHQCTQCKRTW